MHPIEDWSRLEARLLENPQEHIVTLGSAPFLVTSEGVAHLKSLAPSTPWPCPDEIVVNDISRFDLRLDSDLGCGDAGPASP